MTWSISRKSAVGIPALAAWAVWKFHGAQDGWIEKAAAHLVERVHVEPHWDKARGEVVAYENVSLHGLVLVARRKVSYGRIDPQRARQIFIRLSTSVVVPVY